VSISTRGSSASCSLTFREAIIAIPPSARLCTINGTEATWLTLAHRFSC